MSEEQNNDPGSVPATPLRILVVCMGNICRSPMAHGVLRQRLTAEALRSSVEVDSAGTHGYHQGLPPDERAQEAALRRGIDISDLRARMVCSDDFFAFDVILAMDQDNLDFLQRLAADEHRQKVHLFLEFCMGAHSRGVPDPYYGGTIGFERVLDMVEDAVDALMERLGAATRP